MKNVLTKNRRAVFTLFGTATAAFSFALLPSATAQPAQVAHAQRKKGDNPVKSQVTLKVTLDNNPEVVAGEPIVLHYIITNTAQSEEAIAADLGEHYAKLYTLKLVGEDGIALPLLPKPTRNLPVSPIGTEGGILYGGQSCEGFVVVTQRFAPLSKGKYTLALDVDIPYTRYNPNGNNPIIDYENLRSTGLATQGRYTCPITVREAAPSDLVGAASQIRRRFLSSTDAKQKERLATALFSMSPTAVLSVWRRVAYESSASDRPLIAKALAQTFKPEAADVLVKMEINHPVQDSNGNTVSVMRTISEMNYAGSPKLRKHIEGLLASYRVKLPIYGLIAD